MKTGILIIQPKDWTPDDGSEALQELHFVTYQEAVDAYFEIDRDANIVVLKEANENYYNRIQRKPPEAIE